MSQGRLNFNNRVAIVTGSGQGLGREHAVLLGRLGAAVVVNSRTSATAQNTVDDIIKAGGRAIAHVGSVADRAVADAMVKKAVDTFGHVDIIINNAGTADAAPALFEDYTATQLWDMFGVHVGGAFNVTQAAWPYMREQKYGRVVMIASHTMFGIAEQSIYVAAKMALVGLAKSMALEGREHNILVNAIATSGFTPGAERANLGEEIQSLMKRYLPAADAAPVVAWLAHEDSKANGDIFGVQGRLATRIFLAETTGVLGAPGGNWDVETIRDNWDQVVDERGYRTYTSVEELASVTFQRLSSGQS